MTQQQQPTARPVLSNRNAEFELQQHVGKIGRSARQVDSMDFFNLITGPELLEPLEALLPEYRERKYPPTVALAMFLGQVLSADGSCPVSYTHLRAHETRHDLVCRLLL